MATAFPICRPVGLPAALQRVDPVGICIPVSSATDGYIRWLFSYNGKSQGDPTNPFDNVSSYGLLNLYAGHRGHDGMWEISRSNLLFTSY